MGQLEQRAESPHQDKHSFLQHSECNQKPNPWETNPLYQELISSPPYGEGFLMMEDNKEAHHAKRLGQAIIDAVRPEQADIATSGVALALEIMDGERNDGRTPEVNHVFRTTLRALYIKDLTDEELLTIILHDAIEDHPEEFYQKYRSAFQTIAPSDQLNETLNKVEKNINILNKKRQKENRDLTDDEYLQDVEDAGLGWIKVLDRIDSERGDFANAVHEQFSEKTMHRIYRSHTKTLQVEHLVTPEVENEFNQTCIIGEQFITTHVNKKFEAWLQDSSHTVSILDQPSPETVIFTRHLQK